MKRKWKLLEEHDYIEQTIYCYIKLRFMSFVTQNVNGNLSKSINIYCYIKQHDYIEQTN